MPITRNLPLCRRTFVTDLAFNLIMDCGQAMLANGGEVFRAQDTMEIMARVNAVAQRTHEHLAFFALAGVIYFVLTLIVLKLLRRLENKVQIPGYSAGTVGSMANNTQHGVKNA